MPLLCADCIRRHIYLRDAAAAPYLRYAAAALLMLLMRHAAMLTMLYLLLLLLLPPPMRAIFHDAAADYLMPRRAR